MADRTLTPLIEGYTFLEGPRWHDGRLWISDFYTQKVLAVTADGDVEDIVSVPQQPSGLGWLPDGTLLIVSMRDRKLVRHEGGELVEHADLSDIATGHLNDMVVDAQGRAYVGNFGFDLMAGAPFRATPLVRVDPDGTLTVVAEDLKFPNGSVITPDGVTLIVAETFAGRLSVFSLETGERTIWQVGAEVPLGPIEEMLPQSTFAPDGITLDADGHVWAADGLAARVCRIAPGGEIVEEITMPEGLGVFACQLGGDDGRTLLMCAAPDFFEEPRRAAREAVLLTTTVDTPHAGLP